MAKTDKPRTSRPRGKSRRPLTVDWHTHVMLDEVIDFTRDHNVFYGFKKPRKGARPLAGGARLGMVWEPDADKRLKVMDKVGVDVQVVSTSLVHQCCYWAPARKALAMDRLLNDRIADLVASRRDRFVGLASVPLQSVPLAVKELERAIVKGGLRGVNISSNIEGKDLDHASLYPFWTKVLELDVPVYIHPAGAVDPRLQRFFLWNSIGQPYEEAMAMTALIYGGVMDRFPGLKFVIAHGGGFLPHYDGRIDRNYRNREVIRKSIKAPPSTYFKQFYFDTCVYNPKTLKSLAAIVGPGRLLMGSDYPVGELDPIGFVSKDRSLSHKAREDILGRTAAKLLKIDA